MRTIVFLDLDDTLFQTRPKCPPGEGLHPAGYARDGAPLSFMTDRQRRLLGLLSEAGTVIPTTARNLDAFRRVRLPFTNLAILDFGGVILRADGAPDRGWDATVRPRAEAARPALHQALDEVRRFIDSHRLGVNARLVCDFDMPLYLVLKHPEGDPVALEAVRREHWAALDADQFFLHANGNNLSLVPRFLGKERAVRYALDHLLGPGPVLTVGVGDSLTDAPFLQLCDYTVLPRGCQLAGALFSREGP